MSGVQVLEPEEDLLMVEPPELAAEIAERYRKAKLGWQKTRLLCAKLACEGQHQSAQIAASCGCGSSRVFDWLKMLREGGIEGLLKRDKPGPQKGEFKLLKGKPRIKKQLQEGLAEGRWKTSPQLSRWLKEKHGLEVKTNTAFTWLKKSAGSGIPSEAATWKWSSSKQAWGRSLSP